MDKDFSKDLYSKLGEAVVVEEKEATNKPAEDLTTGTVAPKEEEVPEEAPEENKEVISGSGDSVTEEELPE